jgi:hypothetical protein
MLDEWRCIARFVPFMRWVILLSGQAFLPFMVCKNGKAGQGTVNGD